MTDTTVQSKSFPVAGSIADVRREVISGNWQAINNGDYTLTGLGLRHNGNGLVWLRSGVSVHECDHDEGFSGKEKASSEYHTPLRPENQAENKEIMGFVHPQYIDSYCHNILSASEAWCEFSDRQDGRPLATFAVQVSMQKRQQAGEDWHIWRHPDQKDRYTLLSTRYHSGMTNEHKRRGWLQEKPDYLIGIIHNNAEFSRLMIRLGYVQVRTRKITGKKETFWLYRSSHRELAEVTPLRPQDPAPRKASAVTVQASESERTAFRHVAVDGRYLWVYADHIHFLKKIRTRVNGKQVQGYTAKNVNLVTEEHPDSEVCPQNAQNSRDLMVSVQAAPTQYTAGVLSTMTPQGILSAAKNTLMQISTTHGFGMMAHNIMLSHGGRNLVSVPPSNLANCLVELDKLRVTAGKEMVGVIE